MKIKITPELVKEYCAVIGDNNPIHDDDNTVKYGHPVAPGILVTAMITRNPKPYWALAKLNVRYHNAVYVGDTIEFEINYKPVYPSPLGNNSISDKKYTIRINLTN